MSFKKIAILSHAGLCRRCINSKFGLELTPQDCIYQHFPGVCPQCEEMRNIVADLPFRSRVHIFFKMLGRRKK